jgi:membrane protein YdbS with pleckstrin-like domain
MAYLILGKPDLRLPTLSILAVVIVLFSMVWALWIAPELRHFLVTAALRLRRFSLARIGKYL